MSKVFIVVDVSDGMGPNTILRVFSEYDSALYYGEELVSDQVIDEFDIHEREVY